MFSGFFWRLLDANEHWIRFRGMEGVTRKSCDAETKTHFCE
jgi:hypothetical protein